MRHLAQVIASNAESILFRHHLDRLAAALTVRSMVSKLHRVERIKLELEENCALRHFFQETTARAGLQLLLAQLPAQLAKDEADIERRENLDGFSLNEEYVKENIAIKLQARYRGRAARIAMYNKELEAQNQAATMIQAIRRGQS